MSESQNTLDISVGSVLYVVNRYVEPLKNAEPTDIGRLDINSVTVAYSSPLLDSDEILVGIVENEFGRKNYTERITEYKDIDRALSANVEISTLRRLREAGYSNRKVDAIAIFMKKEKATHRLRTEATRAVIREADARIDALVKCAKTISD